MTQSLRHSALPSVFSPGSCPAPHVSSSLLSFHPTCHLQSFGPIRKLSQMVIFKKKNSLKKYHLKPQRTLIYFFILLCLGMCLLLSMMARVGTSLFSSWSLPSPARVSMLITFLGHMQSRFQAWQRASTLSEGWFLRPLCSPGTAL